MEDIYQDISVFLTKIQNQCKTIDESYKTTLTKCKDLQHSLDILTNENQYLKRENTDLNTTISKLEKQIEIVEEDKRQLTRVSHVIALERENNKLKQEISQLNEKLTKQHQQQQAKFDELCNEINKISILSDNKEIIEKDTEIDDKPTMIEKDHKEENLIVEEQEQEQELEVYEKVIKGVTYYVSCNEDMTIYKIDDEGVIGDKLGKLEKINGKTKVVWF